MATLVLDEFLESEILAQRRLMGGDRYDEVWDGVYRMTPLANNEHQELVGEIYAAISDVVKASGNGRVFPGANVSDQLDHWEKNFRAPDVVVVLEGSQAIDRGTHWFGGPDFLVEVASPRDATRDKIPFYSKIGVRELLIVDRDPWGLELYRNVDGALQLVGRSDLATSLALTSDVVPFVFQLVPGEPRPRIQVSAKDCVKVWTI